MAMPPHLRFARPPSEAAERIAVGLLVVYTASTPESNEAWQITTNHYEEQDRSFGSNMSTAERDVLFPHQRQEHRPAATKPHTMQHWKTLG
jgi:hypothetical protein